MVGELKPQTSFRSWRLKSETQVWAGLVPPETSLLGALTAGSSLSPHCSALCVWVSVLTSSSYKDPGPVGSGSTLVTSFYLNAFFKDLISKCIMTSWELGLQHDEQGYGHHLVHKKQVDVPRKDSVSKTIMPVHFSLTFPLQFIQSVIFTNFSRTLRILFPD